MGTNALYLEDSYLKEFKSRVLEVFKGPDFTAFTLEETAFYPSGGGQPSDRGKAFLNDTSFTIVEAYKRDGKIWHVTKDDVVIEPGQDIRVVIDWDYRYRLMRMHTAAHLLSALMHDKEGVLITGNQLGYEKSRIDFSLQEFDKEKFVKIVELANALIEKGAKVSHYYMPREEVERDATLSKLAKGLPPGLKELRIVEIEGIDRQADGGTHVKDIKEIGKILLLKLENKGKSNRRLYYTLEP